MSAPKKKGNTLLRPRGGKHRKGKTNLKWIKNEALVVVPETTMRREIQTEKRRKANQTRRELQRELMAQVSNISKKKKKQEWCINIYSMKQFHYSFPLDVGSC